MTKRDEQILGWIQQIKDTAFSLAREEKVDDVWFLTALESLQARIKE